MYFIAGGDCNADRRTESGGVIIIVFTMDPSMFEKEAGGLIRRLARLLNVILRLDNDEYGKPRVAPYNTKEGQL